ncbi:hypothetical protein RclHR1_03320008 [Rhizophagus clarus]|uniref:F-box domain-containing protein n=1 Tax=Rhizophagus clarus TaxID=94130 RepID=A0A2Z6RCU6_9GLOM|nr:hypothetical protein RclHR1_03320008 [Rhizophagus clarus]GET00424.1 hypothetical protein GLOIN_2v1784405 [Rhizophagus clarus]
MSQLPVDCLNEIFEYLENDKASLHSCLLVNRLWCEVSVRILWRNSWNYNSFNYITLISCLSDESKEILSNNGIIILNSTSKPPMFDYASFCKVLSVDSVYYLIGVLLKSNHIISSSNLYDNILNLSQELLKLFMSQITSLKELYFLEVSNANLISYSGAKDCLSNISELHCNSNISPDFFYQLSQICHNISTLNIMFIEDTSIGLKELISVQRNLKHFGITQYDCKDLSYIIPSLKENLSDNTLIKLRLNTGTPLLFISNFKNLQELELSADFNDNFEKFDKLQYINFPQLQILKIPYPGEFLIKFLEINGKYLKEIYISDSEGYSDNLLNLSIAKFCLNIRKLSTGFKNDELETLESVFNNCRYLESIKLWCGDVYLSEKEALEMVIRCSSDNMCEIILYHLFNVRPRLLPVELESLLIEWKNRKPQKSLSLIIVNIDDKSLDANDENMKLIDKYIKLGVIKKFKVTDFEDIEFNPDYRKEVQKMLYQ